MVKRLKILLLGEYSNYHNNLAKGLLELGHEVILANAGDHYKNYYRDIDLSYHSKNKVKSAVKRIWIENKKIGLLKGFDIVQIINPNTFSRFGNNISLFRQLFLNNDKVFLSAVGDDYFWWKAYREGKFEKSPHKGTLEDEGKMQSIWETSKSLIKANEFLVQNASGIIPGCISYKIPYEHFSNCRKIILQPIDVMKHDFIENIIRDKIVFFHGGQIGRYGFKGTRVIDQVMSDLSSKYASDLIYKRTDSIPYDEYIKIINETNILIDQINFIEPTMNALISMLKGKVVMGGCEEVFLKTHGIKELPLINISENKKQFTSKVEWILDNRMLVKNMSLLASDYVKEKHSNIKIAREFVKEWKN
ncbi:hypothetical protein SAMN04489761_1482 [Tenacibaculum sp. MAR_2009_124]|uniref:hypothetical protein n=1 Tax=Tenacibaculum sp. MAR_2009_124 TaxID=1250059 RepID=UPI000894F793|nr:hypothetical protein [Tenacibaculum sp. MAR_2009_124]SEB69641.1 hypothetical protein SAMN04489761_1482 [Tenacibaculum sp. MAR_2009_124]